jgi:hypothetical protein
MFWWIASFVVLATITIFIGPKRVSAVSPHRGLAAGEAKTEWKKAKDRFLIEVKKLSQCPALSEREKEIIRNIEQSWNGYDISFQKYVLASTKQGFWLLSMWLGILTALIVLLATVVVVSRRKTPAAQPHPQGPAPGFSLDDLMKQAEGLQQALMEIKTLMDQVEKVPTALPAEEVEKASNLDAGK